MEITTSKIQPSRKRIATRVTILSLVVGGALAAALFVANSQPWGYIAPPALSGANFGKGNVVAYTPWFENGTFRGDLMALSVNSDGTVNYLSPTWRASQSLDLQHYLTGRRIVTTDGLGTGIPFQFASLTAGQKLQLGSESLLNFVRGDRSNESAAGYRVRSSVLGDIIHSPPVYVGRPSAGYIFGSYSSFASANSSRSPQIYVGANDGMLHAFDAASGTETFAFVPSAVLGNLPKLAVQPYSHQYFVDGFLTVQDAQFGATWHSVLVGGLGAGGKGFYALDVTSAGAASEAAVTSKILWEFQSGSTGAENLGYSYSRPSIVRLANGEWAAIVGNGYLSATGAASLFVLDIQTGAVIQELVVQDANANGLSSPTLIDADGDGRVDTAYAGDLNGNLWKFDLGAVSPASWTVAFGGQPLFQTDQINGVRQAITTAPEVGRHPEGGVMVYVGTGRLFSVVDSIDMTIQAVYGIWDNDWAVTAVPIGIAQLLGQQLNQTIHVSGASVRVATASYPDWSVARGWMTPIEPGERVIQDIVLRDNRVSFMAVNSTIGSGENWLIQLNALTGGAPSKTIIDINGDSKLDVQDNVDGDGDGQVNDTPLDRVVGQYQSFGLASRPVAGVLSAGNDAALINHLNAIPPGEGAPTDDPGLLGGHFDLDTSHLIYPFDAGIPVCDKDGLPVGCLLNAVADTDGHVHEWDDIHDLTTIDFFALPDGGGSPLFEINDGDNSVDEDDEFILTISNENLSPGGVLEINGASISVVQYGELLDRYLTGTLGGGETMPVFTLDVPTPAQVTQGVQQLFGLKLSFDSFAILKGDLLPTKTGCVKGNVPGALDEYRNGALMIQALDTKDVSGGFVYDAFSDEYVAASAALNASLGYATKGLLWESTVFWHWDGPCYGEVGWDTLYDSCVIQGQGGCTKVESPGKSEGKGKGKDKDKDKDEDGGDPSPPLPPPVEIDPGHAVSSTVVGGNSDTGRLFWKELVPE